jgi:hypothetical protein
MKVMVLALVGLAPWLGCSGSDEQREPPPAATAGAGGDASEPRAEAGAGGEASFEAPVEETALLAFLDEKQYATWPKEAAIHDSAGPHGEAVRVYYSPKAAAAFGRGETNLPAGAASVKELSRDGKLYGYSVWVKVQEQADAGRGFFWYEIVNGNGTSTVYGNALGSPDCVGCHAAGTDYSLSTLPFE